MTQEPTKAKPWNCDQLIIQIVTHPYRKNVQVVLSDTVRQAMAPGKPCNEIINGVSRENILLDTIKFLDLKLQFHTKKPFQIAGYDVMFTLKNPKS